MVPIKSSCSKKTVFCTHQRMENCLLAYHAKANLSGLNDAFNLFLQKQKIVGGTYHKRLFRGQQGAATRSQCAREGG